MTHPAPLAVFAYRRLPHLRRTMDALVTCPEFCESPVFVFSDGPKGSADAADVDAVRMLVRSRMKPNITLIESPVNLGLANSVISGVSRVCREYGCVIVIEDDIVVHPSALTWFNQALDKYKNDNVVMQVGGYQYDVPEFADRRSGTFQRFVTSWGWATWDRAWQHFDPKATGWQELQENSNLRRAFDVDGAYPYSPMIEAQMAGRIDSWAIRWWWAVFQAGGLSLLPPRSLVNNVGFDESATHNTVGALKAWVSGPRPKLWDEPKPPTFPEAAELVPEEQGYFRKALIRTNARRNYNIKRALSRLGVKRFTT